jgi:hypothetical protein
VLPRQTSLALRQIRLCMTQIPILTRATDPRAILLICLLLDPLRMLLLWSVLCLDPELGCKKVKQPKIWTDGTICYGLLTAAGEPCSLQEALDDANWRKAMGEEFEALLKNKTWHLVPSSPNKNLIDCK